MIANEKYPTRVFSLERIKAPIIKKGVKIGINATILPGITIGENSLIEVGLVVTKNIPSNSVTYGIPARIIKENE
jgi:Serine acetyltransferase